MRDAFLPKATLFLGIILCLTGCSIRQVLRIKDRRIIDVKTMIDELRGSPLVFVGERHDASSSP